MLLEICLGSSDLLFYVFYVFVFFFFFFQAEDGIRDHCVTGVQTCALPIWGRRPRARARDHLQRRSWAGGRGDRHPGGPRGHRSEERREGKSVDLGGRRIIKKKKRKKIKMKRRQQNNKYNKHKTI